jgi:hypothetical protein
MKSDFQVRIFILIFLFLACNQSTNDWGSGHSSAILGQPAVQNINYFDHVQKGNTCSHATAANMIKFYTGENAYGKLVNQFQGDEYYIGVLLRWWFDEIAIDYTQDPAIFKDMLESIYWGEECVAMLLNVTGKGHYITAWFYDPNGEILYFTNGADYHKGLMWEYLENMFIKQIVIMEIETM